MDESLIGKVFEDRDWRMNGRRIQVLEAFEKRDPWNAIYPAYRVVTVAAPNAPTSVGNRSSIGAANLHKRYREVTE